ncbi:hypothetical protein HPB50_004689 [Hyalomma asiaticum]|uniref:Uncharacterized protein n=1 Tax=Hyalomma asiaticum TaxID=266040 RepID=A0ACB7SVN1_HYAAI|nr:hypothetical protein HPB50_004689 [Hyalomma asiaticum]
MTASPGRGLVQPALQLFVGPRSCGSDFLFFEPAAAERASHVTSRLLRIDEAIQRAQCACASAVQRRPQGADLRGKVSSFTDFATTKSP